MDPNINYLIGGLVLAAVVFIIARSRKDDNRPAPPPYDGWTCGPVIRGENYSRGMLLHPPVTAEGLVLDMPTPEAEPHYLTRPGSLVGKSYLRIVVSVEGGPFHPTKVSGAQATMTPFFQRRGDTWDAAHEAYRWFASFATAPVVPGVHVLYAPLSDNWTAVLGSSRVSEPDAFAAAVADVECLGLVFGGGDGLGHGIRAANPSRIVILSCEVE